MSTWKDVGDWLKTKGASGAGMVGALLTGNIPKAIEHGVSLVTNVTGYSTPNQALDALQNNPTQMIRLQELAIQNEANIRAHIVEMEKIQLELEKAEIEDRQKEHHETQETIRAGDIAQDVFVRATRPGLAWCGFFGAFAYIMLIDNPNEFFFQFFVGLPYAYMGARGYDKYLKEKKGKNILTNGSCGL